MKHFQIDDDNYMANNSFSIKYKQNKNPYAWDSISFDQSIQFDPQKNQLNNPFSSRQYKTNKNTTSTFEDIISIDLLSEIKQGNIDDLDDHIKNMLTFTISTQTNYPLSQLTSSFQLLLNYLFDLQSEIINSNTSLEDRIDDLHEVNMDKKVDHINKVVSNQRHLIDNLNKRQSLLKKIIIANGYEHKLVEKLMPGQRKIYICDVCDENKIYTNYDRFHAHYVRNHIKKDLEEKVEKEYALDMDYFNKKIRNMTDEMINALNPSSFIEENEKDDIEVIDDIGNVIIENEEKLNDMNDNEYNNPLLSMNKSIKMNVYTNQMTDDFNRIKGIGIDSNRTKSSFAQNTPQGRSSNIVIDQVINRHEKDYSVLLNDFIDFKQEIMSKLDNIVEHA